MPDVLTDWKGRAPSPLCRLHDPAHGQIEHAFDQGIALAPGEFRIVDQRGDKAVQAILEKFTDQIEIAVDFK